MDLTLTTALIGGGLFAGMLLCFEAGHRLGQRRLARGGSEPGKGAGAAEAAVFGLMGLLIIFVIGQSIWLGKHIETKDGERKP